MKKTICIILAIMCTFCIFARDKHVTASESGRLVEDLLDDGLYRNQEQILSAVPVLTPAELTLLYNKNRESALKDTLMNGLLGFGLGSFSAGDRKGGWIQLGCELGGAVLTVTSAGTILGNMVVLLFTAVPRGLSGQGSYNDDDNLGKMTAAAVLGLVTGLGIFTGGRIYGIVRGIKYPKQYNKDLQETLYGTSQSGPTLSLAPVITPQSIGFGVGVKF